MVKKDIFNKREIILLKLNLLPKGRTCIVSAEMVGNWKAGHGKLVTIAISQSFEFL